MFDAALTVMQHRRHSVIVPFHHLLMMEAGLGKAECQAAASTKSSMLRMMIPHSQVEGQHRAAIGLFDQTLCCPPEQPGDFDAVPLGDAFELGVLLAGQCGRDTHRVPSILCPSRSPRFSAAIRGSVFIIPSVEPDHNNKFDPLNRRVTRAP